MQEKHSPIVLPPGVSFRKEPLAVGWAYVFRHAQLGELGRIRLQEHSGGRTHLSCEVVGDPEDPVTEERAALFKPLALELSAALEKAIGSGATGSGVAGSGGGATSPPSATWVDPPPQPAPLPERVESKLMQCDRCGAGVALLIFADHATDRGGLEDYARLMYAHVVRLRVPTWVIGPPSGDGPPEEQPADVLKIWPEREPVCRLSPDAFNAVLGALAATHCP